MTSDQLRTWSERMARHGWVDVKTAELWLIAKANGENPALVLARWTIGEPAWAKMTAGATSEAIQTYYDVNGYTRQVMSCERAAEASKRRRDETRMLKPNSEAA